MFWPRPQPLRRLLTWSGVSLGLAASACSSGETATGFLEPPPTGSLAVTVGGVPDGATAVVSVTGPAGYAHSLGSSDTLRGLALGSYTLAAADLGMGGNTWRPTPAQQTVQVNTRGATASAAVDYVIVTGALAVTLSGLPDSVPGAITVSGPEGFSQSLSASRTFAGLVPGAYTVAGPDVTAGTAVYRPTLPADPVTVPAGTVPVPVTVAYTRQTGSLAITVEGLPPGSQASATLSGPGGFSVTVGGSGVIPDLDPGSYTLSAAPVASGGNTWSPAAASQTLTVTPGQTTDATVQYAISTGGLTVTIVGLPQGTAANATVTGPEGFSASLTGTGAFAGLVPGNYTIAAVAVTSGGQSYAPAPASQSLVVAASLTPAAATVSYAPSTGSLAVMVSGLPGSTSASITVTGPGGYSRAVTRSGTLSGLSPGTYTVTAAAVTTGGQTYAPSPTSRNVSLAAGTTATAGVVYAQSTGSLAVTVTGLPAGVSASLSVTGPATSRTVTGSTTLTNLAPGNYTIAASSVTGAGTVYTPTPASQVEGVTAAATAAATVAYAAPPATSLNLRVDGVYLTQAAQRYDGSVPLVAGRDAYLRVFAVANQSNTVTPAVRIRLYSGPTLVQTYTLNAPGGSVPLAANEGVLTSSWNVLVPAGLVQPGLSVLADVDPASAIAEADETDNVFPASGTPAPVDVRALPTFAVRFIPVLQQVNGLQGNVSGSNSEQFLADLKKLLPVGAYNADIRAPYTTTAAVLQSDNANGAWGTILSEVLALRTADASSRYYYGVVRTGYSSGVAGIGYVGGSARTALGWDRLPSGSGVMAHEVGHNMGRQHAPCGGASSPDPSYPYAGGQIGIWGLDVTTLALKSPTGYLDLMGYCSPNWVSDYNWSAMVSYRQSGPNNSAPGPTGQGTTRGLLVWGRITRTGPVLEPAFVVDAPVSPPAPGPHRLDGIGVDGSVLFSLPFSATELADLPSGPEAAFAFVLPLDHGLALELAGLRVTAAGQTATVRAGRTEAPPATSLGRDAAGRAVLRWDASRYPMVLVRDAVTGQVLSFARAGELHLPMAGGRFQLTYSDGVRSRREDSMLR